MNWKEKSGVAASAEMAKCGHFNELIKSYFLLEWASNL